MDVYLNKDNLAEYIIGKYEKEKELRISPIKLQKSMYLLFAMWGGNAYLINEIMKESNSIEIEEYLHLHLFKPNFEAWGYGVVDVDVYEKFKQEQYSGKLNLKIKCQEHSSTILDFVDDILSQTFDLCDFKLAEITRGDMSWRKALEYKDRKMNIRDIVLEYAQHLEL